MQTTSVVDSSATLAGSGRHRADIQALRAIAVILVVVYHADLKLSGGFIGVDMFFVISGFVITSLLARELETTAGLRFRDFYSRRVRRLLPALTLVLIVTLALSVATLSPTGTQQKAAHTAGAAAAFGSNLYLYRFGVPYFDAESLNPFLHTWSLGVEEQVYAVLPLLMAGLWWIGRRCRQPRQVALIGLAAVSLASFALGAAASYGWSGVPLPQRFAFYVPLSRLWEFGAGAMCAILVVRLPKRRATGFVIGASGLVTVCGAALALDASSRFPGYAATIPVAGTVALIIAGSMSTDWAQACARPWLVWIGDISYEWYLWHWPAIVLVSVTWPGSHWAKWMVAALSIPLAAITRRFVTERFRHDTRVVGRRAATFTAVCVSVPLLLSLAMSAAADRGWGVQSLQRVADAQRRSAAEGAGCDSLLRTTGCLFGDSSEQTVVLIGDSQASAISDSVHSVAADLGARFGIWTRPGCPFLVDVSVSERCRDWVADVTRWLSEVRPAVLIVHLAALNYTDDTRAGGTAVGRTPAEFADGIRGIERVMNPFGTKIVFLGPIPLHEKSMMSFASLVRPDPTPDIVTRAAADERARPLLSAIANVAAGGTSIALIDPVPWLCTDDECSQFRNGWIYRDEGHLSPKGAELLLPAIDAAIQPLLAETSS